MIDILIDGKSYGKHIVLPFSMQFSIDRSLDVASVKLVGLANNIKFKPFQDVVIVLDDNRYYFFVADIQKTEIIAKGIANYELLLIEQSKLLERFVNISKTNTNKISRNNYTFSKVPIMIQYPDDTYKFYKIAGKQIYLSAGGYEPYASIRNPQIDYFVQFPSFNIFWEIAFQGMAIKPDRAIKMEIYQDDRLILSTTDLNISFFKTMPNGKYEAKYYIKEESGVIRLSVSYGLISPETSYEFTIPEVVDNLLATFETRKVKDNPRFTLDTAFVEKFKNVKAPEFSLIGTLWECLSEIGDFINAIPRLEQGVIYFDDLKAREEANIKDMPYMSNMQEYSVEQYLTNLDSQVSNIINTDNVNNATIVYPNRASKKTLRTEIGTVQITSDNAFMKVEQPIESVKRVVLGRLKNGTEIGDITEYVVSATAYQVLSSYSGEYPTSKAFALYFEKGGYGIKGLFFKLPNAVSQVFEVPAIINIIARKLGISTSEISVSELLDLQYQIEYVPIEEVRAIECKENLEDLGIKSAITFNQQSNIVNSFAYGENLKSLVNRLGKPEELKMFILKDYKDMVKVGQKFDKDTLISVVKYEFYPNFYKCELALSKNFHIINKYVGVKSEKRFSEIASQPAVDRYPALEDYCIIGNAPIGYSLDQSSAVGAIGSLARQFKDNQTFDGKAVDTVLARTSLKSGNSQRELVQVYLPINTFASGNSNIFQFKFVDNYSAGDSRYKVAGSNLQYDVRYCDTFGKVDFLDFKMGKGGTTAVNYAELVEEGNMLPYTNPYTKINRVEFEVKADNPIDLRKDNRESVVMEYILHFVKNDKDLIFGKALSQSNVFVNANCESFNLYLLQNEFYEEKIDLTNATKLTLNPTFDASEITLNANNEVACGSGKAWAIVDSESNLVFGKNVDIVDKIILPKLYFTHRLEKEN